MYLCLLRRTGRIGMFTLIPMTSTSSWPRLGATLLHLSQRPQVRLPPLEWVIMWPLTVPMAIVLRQLVALVWWHSALAVVGVVGTFGVGFDDV